MREFGGGGGSKILKVACLYIIGRLLLLWILFEIWGGGSKILKLRACI